MVIHLGIYRLSDSAYMLQIFNNWQKSGVGGSTWPPAPPKKIAGYFDQTTNQSPPSPGKPTFDAISWWVARNDHKTWSEVPTSIGLIFRAV